MSASDSDLATRSGDKLRMNRIKIIVEQHADGFAAYPVGVKGIGVGEGDAAEEAIADVHSAIQFHVDTFGSGANYQA